MSCGKDQGEGSPKQAGPCWFARQCWLATKRANLYPPGVWFADAMPSFSAGVTLVLFRFHLYIFVEVVALRSIVLAISRRPDSHMCFFLFPFCFFGAVAFSENFRTIAVFSLYGEYVVPTLVRFSLPDCVFLSCDHRLDFFPSAQTM